MDKIYRLEGLDCANCAMKIEKNISKMKGVQEVSVDFVQKKMFVTFEGNIETAIKKRIVELEDNIDVIDISKKASIQKEVMPKVYHEEHEHEGCGCGHHHEEHEQESCGCGEHHEEHKHEGCECGHHHEEHEQESCGCGEHHEEHEHEGCECGHQHEEHEHEGCGCGEHHHEERVERLIPGAQKLYIKGLDCANCANKIEQHVSRMDNVKDASLNFSTGVFFIEVVDSAKADKTIQEIMKVVPTLEDNITIEKEKAVKQEKTSHSMFSFYVNWRLYVGILVFAIALFFEEEPYSIWIFIVAYVLTGGKVVYSAIRNILRGEVFDENFLMSVATIGAFLTKSYEEAVAVMIFYEVGEMFQSFAVQRSRSSISSLMDIRADHANVWVNGKEIVVDPQTVKIDDIIIIKPGERVPLDGIVIEGNGALDTSALTGESLPRDVEKDDEVLAGVVNLTSVLKVRVTKAYGESTVARILELVENASSKKAPMEKFITKFAKVYTPVVVGLAILLAVLPMIFIPNAVFEEWLYRALTFLVVSCPCALVISVPLGLFAGIGAASRKGILIKGGNYLEALNKIDTVVFDKTGTLTKGKFGIQKIYAPLGDEKEVLKLAAYGEVHSTHPIALSIRVAYGNDIDMASLKNYEEIAGHGVKVEYDGQVVYVGNHKLMEAHGIAYAQSDALGTIVHVARNQEYIGYIVIGDEIKETSKQAIIDLKNCGVTKTVMLSGDRKEVGEHVASQLGLDEVYMQLLPADKVEKVETLLQQEAKDKNLAFVGDGINDAPVLARADVGVAMGGIGSDAAIEAADIVLMKDDPSALATSIRIARKTMKILWQNIVFSLGIKAIILVLTAFGFANMWLGVFADVGVTLLAILNSMRALNVE